MFILNISSLIICFCIIIFIFELDAQKYNCEKNIKRIIVIVLLIINILLNILVIISGTKNKLIIENTFLFLLLIIATLSYLVSLNETKCKYIYKNEILYNILSYFTNSIDFITKIFIYFLICYVIFVVFIHSPYQYLKKIFKA